MSIWLCEKVYPILPQLAARTGLEPEGQPWPLSAIHRLRRRIAEPSHELANVLRPQIRERHCVVAGRRLGSWLNDISALPELWYDALKNLQLVGIKLIIREIEREKFRADFGKLGLRIVAE